VDPAPPYPPAGSRPPALGWRPLQRLQQPRRPRPGAMGDVKVSVLGITPNRSSAPERGRAGAEVR
jgi:hypothetical protein